MFWRAEIFPSLCAKQNYDLLAIHCLPILRIVLVVGVVLLASFCAGQPQGAKTVVLEKHEGENVGSIPVAPAKVQSLSNTSLLRS